MQTRTLSRRKIQLEEFTEQKKAQQTTEKIFDDSKKKNIVNKVEQRIGLIKEVANRNLSSDEYVTINQTYADSLCTKVNSDILKKARAGANFDSQLLYMIESQRKCKHDVEGNIHINEISLLSRLTPPSNNEDSNQVSSVLRFEISLHALKQLHNGRDDHVRQLDVKVYEYDLNSQHVKDTVQAFQKKYRLNRQDTDSLLNYVQNMVESERIACKVKKLMLFIQDITADHLLVYFQTYLSKNSGSHSLENQSANLIEFSKQVKKFRDKMETMIFTEMLCLSGKENYHFDRAPIIDVLRYKLMINLDLAFKNAIAEAETIIKKYKDLDFYIAKIGFGNKSDFQAEIVTNKKFPRQLKKSKDTTDIKKNLVQMFAPKQSDKKRPISEKNYKKFERNPDEISNVTTDRRDVAQSKELPIFLRSQADIQKGDQNNFKDLISERLKYKAEMRRAYQNLHQQKNVIKTNRPSGLHNLDQVIRFHCGDSRINNS